MAGKFSIVDILVCDKIIPPIYFFSELQDIKRCLRSSTQKRIWIDKVLTKKLVSPGSDYIEVTRNTMGSLQHHYNSHENSIIAVCSCVYSVVNKDDCKRFFIPIKMFLSNAYQLSLNFMHNFVINYKRTFPMCNYGRRRAHINHRSAK